MSAAALLATDPASAETHARAILDEFPGQPHALGLLASARHLTADKIGARTEFEAYASEHPKLASIHCELGLLLADMNEPAQSAQSLSRTVDLEPNHPLAWRHFGDQSVKAGNLAAAGDAYVRHLSLTARELRYLQDALAGGDMNLDLALDRLANSVETAPTNVCAALMLAQVCVGFSRHSEAETRLDDILRRSPDFALARYALATVLQKQTRIEDAIRQLDLLLEDDPRNAACLNQKALSLIYLGEYDKAIACYEVLLREEPSAAAFWVGYGHALKTVGQLDKAVTALRKAIALQPDLGEAYWQLADLKTFRFSDADIAAMRKQLSRTTIGEETGVQLHFALGKALEDKKDYEHAFEEYAKGNAARRRSVNYDPEVVTSLARRSEMVFTPEFFHARDGAGCRSPEPIFVVGLTRSGSTLIEQILASHPLVEGTQELPAINLLAARLDENASAYPEILARLDRDELRRLGDEYLETARPYRKLGRVYFIDKMPSNFLHLGLLRLILPRAKIIDARRHPLACGFANFKQHFTRGQAWSYDLKEIGLYYRDYVRLLAHFDHVLPGWIHRVVYEEMIADPEREVRRLLDFCNIPFDDACLRFYENDRPVLTASAEQVRRPIFRDALEQWRHFEPWLTPMKAALGNVLNCYPAAPRFALEEGA